jgi:hypothetical protein
LQVPKFGYVYLHFEIASIQYWLCVLASVFEGLCIVTAYHNLLLFTRGPSYIV